MCIDISTHRTIATFANATLLTFLVYLLPPSFPLSLFLFPFFVLFISTPRRSFFADKFADQRRDLDTKSEPTRGFRWFFIRILRIDSLKGRMLFYELLFRYGIIHQRCILVKVLR